MANPNPTTLTLTWFGGTSAQRYLSMGLQHATDERKDDKEFVLNYVRMNGEAFQYASPRLRDDEEVLVAAMQTTSSWIFDFASPRLRGEKKDVLEALNKIQTVGEVFQRYQDLPIYLKLDRDVVLAFTLASRGEVMILLPLKFRGDRGVFLLTLQQSENGYPLRYTCPYLHQDRYLLVDAIAKFPNLLTDATGPFHQYQNDKSIIIEAMKYNLQVLDDAPNFRDDEEVLRAAVNDRPDLVLQEPFRLLLRIHKDVVLSTLRHKIRLDFSELEPNFRQDKDVVIAFLDQHRDSFALGTRELRQLTTDFHDDYDVVLAAVTNIGHMLEYASQRLRDNREVVLAAVKTSEIAFQYASPELKNNKELVLAAVSAQSRAFEYVSEQLKDDADVVVAAMSGFGLFSVGVLQHASARIKRNREIVFKAISIESYSLQYASDDLKGDRDVVLAAITKDGFALSYASEDLQNDQSLVMIAVSSSPDCLRRIGFEYRRSVPVLIAVGQRNPSVMFRHGVCPDEWGQGEMPLSEYISKLLWRVDARGQEHGWLKKKFDRSSCPIPTSIDVNPQVHQYMHKIFLVREISSQFELSDDTTARIMGYASLRIDLQNYQELARCQDLLNLIVVHDYSDEHGEDKFVIDENGVETDEENLCNLLEHIIQKVYSDDQHP